MDDKVKVILDDLCRAIDEGLKGSERIAEGLRRLEELGFQFAVYVEATLLLTKKEAAASKRGRRTTRSIRSGSLKLSEKDLKYLKSLKIALHTQGGEPGDDRRR